MSLPLSAFGLVAVQAARRHLVPAPVRPAASRDHGASWWRSASMALAIALHLQALSSTAPADPPGEAGMADD